MKRKILGSIFLLMGLVVGCSQETQLRAVNNNINKSFKSNIESVENLKVDTTEIREKKILSDLLGSLVVYHRKQIMSRGVVKEEDIEQVAVLLPAVQSDFYVNTYDSKNGSKDGPSESIKATDKEKGISIVKYYQIRDEITGNIITMSYYVTEGVSNHVNIQDEQNINGYKLMDWFTSSDNWTPVGDVGVVSYEALKSIHSNGSNAGNFADRISLGEENQDKVLHLMYELHPAEKHLDVIKVFMDGEVLEGINTDERLSGNFLNEYSIVNIGYDLKDIKVSSEPPIEVLGWDSLNNIESFDLSKLRNDKLKLESGINTVYLLYDKTKFDVLTLYANELSHRFTLKDLTNNKLFKVTNHVPSALEGRAFVAECNGHKCGDSSCQKLHYCSNEFKYLVPGGNYFFDQIEDNFNYDFQSSFICDYQAVGNLSVSQFVTWDGGNKLDSYLEPNAEFTVYRDKSRDKVTLYPGLNHLLDGLGKIGLSLTLDESYVPKNKREATVSFTEESYNNTLETHWKPSDARKSDIHWKWVLISPYGKEVSQDSYEIGYERGHGPSDANDYYTQEGNVETKYYVGLENQGFEPLGDIDNTHSIKNQRLRFYPYIKMKYMDKNWKESDVYITSENLSQVDTYDSIYERDINRYRYKYKDLESFVPWNQVKIKNRDKDLDCLFKTSFIQYKKLDWDNYKKCREYQVCLDDTKVQAVDSSGFIRSESEVRDYFLNKYKVTEESEYIMKQSHTEVYEVHTDTDGNLWVTKDGRQLGEKGKELEVLLKNKEISELDDNTKVVTNLYLGLDRNTESLDREGKPWYFEAFDGLKVIVCDTTYIR